MESNKPQIMGILNATPDSFSDGGRYFELEKSIERCGELAREGADIIDIGGESTRPFASPVSPEEEKNRVIPLIKEISKFLNIPISIDTTKASIAALALESGAKILNDISGLDSDPEMSAVVKHYKPTVILMHRKGTPQTMKGLSSKAPEMIDDLKMKTERALSLGLQKEQIILDPGLGFGKTSEDNWQILHQISDFKALGFPFLIGASRKSFLGEVVGGEPHERDLASLAVTAWCFLKKVDIVRVHNVGMTRQFLKIWEKLHA